MGNLSKIVKSLRHHTKKPYRCLNKLAAEHDNTPTEPTVPTG